LNYALKWLLYITLLSGIGLLVFWYFQQKAKIKPIGNTYEEKLATVVQVIYDTPEWLLYIQNHAAEKGEALEVPLMHSARHDLDRRGLEDIIANPKNFIRCFD
jgi:hypothetical protein